MDLTVLKELVTSVGFPIAACIYMAHLVEQNSKDREKYAVILEKMTDRLEDIEKKIDSLIHG